MKKSEIIVNHIEKICQHLYHDTDAIYKEYNEFFRHYDILSIPIEETDYLIEQCKNLMNTYTLELQTIYIYSALIQLSKKEEIYCEFITWIINSSLNYKAKYYLFIKIKTYSFHAVDQLGTATFIATTRLLQTITKEASNYFTDELLLPIPVEERNKNLVIVIISQLIGDTHGPTKHALDHCVTLMKTMHKQVLLINTAEMGNSSVCILTYNHRPFNYVDKYLDCETFTFKDTEIPFFQCNNDMPNEGELALLLQTIKQLKPYFAIEIGSGSLFASLLTKMVPVLTNGTMHSLIESTISPYQTIARPLTSEETNALLQLGYNPENIIISMFTSTVRPETEIVNRVDWGVPENAFLVGVVGTRLNTEITEEFIDLLNSVTKENIYFIFFGLFDKFMEIVEPYEERNSHMVYFGPTKDTMACLKQCDLYLNPHRVGGGMSAIEAMAAGLPAVSTPYGDGGVVLGKDFWVDSIDDMPGIILKYATDKEFYLQKSEIARKRGEYLQNSDLVFKDTVEEFINKAILNK